MDALTRFYSGRSRSPAPPDDDAEWDAVIARAKQKAAELRTPIRLPPAAVGYASLEMQPTPPPIPLAVVRATARPTAALPRIPERTRATLDALMQGGLHSAASRRPALAARQPGDEEMVTPPPVAKPGWAARPSFGRARRP